MPSRCLAIAGFSISALFAPFGAVAALAQASSIVEPINHGSRLTQRHVGPVAARLAPVQHFHGGEVRDGRAYPFARQVPGPATYDGFRVEGPHLLIERSLFTSPLDFYVRQPVVLRGVEIRTTGKAPWALHSRPEAGPLFFLWSTAGAGSTAGAPADRSHALERALYLRSDRVTVYRSHLTRAADGIQIHARDTRVIETLIDGLVYWEGDHNDGIQMLGRGAETQILRSRIVNANPQTSALNLIGNGVLVADSYLSGGGWTVYGGAHHTGRKPGSTRGVVFKDNVFGREIFPKGGNFGAVTGYDAAGHGNAWSGNRFGDGPSIVMGGETARN